LMTGRTGLSDATTVSLISPNIWSGLQVTNYIYLIYSYLWYVCGSACVLQSYYLTNDHLFFGSCWYGYLTSIELKTGKHNFALVIVLIDNPPLDYS
jgi:hypothetical protein